jgi:histidyl-tRNA synthetase
MRILDSKEAADKQLLVDAPKLSDSLTPAARYRFDRVRRELEQLGTHFSPFNYCPFLSV